MNIWLLHPFAGGPGLGRHWRPFWLAEAWIRMGHCPLIVTATSHHLRQKLQVPGPRQINGVDFWFLETPSYGASKLGRLRNNLAFGPRFRRDAPLMQERFGKADLIVASSPHLFFVAAAHREARRLDAKFWIEIRDLWPESIVALGMVPAWNPLVSVLGWKEREAYRVADRVVSLLAGAEAYMISRGLPANKFIWVPNGVSEAEIISMHRIEKEPHPFVDRIRTMKEQGRRIILYAGSMGPPQAMDVIIDAAKALSKTTPDIFFVLIGSGSSRAELERRAANLANVEFLDEVDRPVVQSMLRESDCAVLSFHKNAIFDHGISPNKLFDYCLFAPRTVIACGEKALTNLESLVTLRCDPGDPDALARTLVSALQSEGRSLNDRKVAVERFNYSLLAKRFLAMPG